MTTKKPLFFYSHYEKSGDEYDSHVFSQFYLCSFVDKHGVLYCCAEQYMMAEKTRLFLKDKDNIVILAKILGSTDPRIIKSLGRKVKNFNNDIWNKRKYEIVKEGNFFKFSQNENLKKILLNTGDMELIEAAQNDAIWGIGFLAKEALQIGREKWGENLLGKALMDVRQKISDGENISNS